MAAAPQPLSPQPLSKVTRLLPASPGLAEPGNHSPQVTPASETAPHLITVEALRPAQRPRWLQELRAIQGLTLLLALGLAGAVLVVYGASVQTQRQLNTATRRLQELQQREQQLATGTALLQHHLAQQSGVQNAQELGGSAIFLKPTVVPEVEASPGPAPLSGSGRSPLSARPLGY